MWGLIARRTSGQSFSIAGMLGLPSSLSKEGVA